MAKITQYALQNEKFVEIILQDINTTQVMDYINGLKKYYISVKEIY